MINRFSFLTKIKTWFTKPKKLLIIGAIIAAAIIAVFFIFNNEEPKQTEKPTVNINQTYTVVARTKDRKATDGEIRLTVTNAQTASSILVQGQKWARPVKGKIFLILNMEVENTYKVPLYVYPEDLFRFVRTDDGQKFAPAVHQGPVEIRPQSTKKSNLAFVVSPEEKHFFIELGEIGKTKDTLEITF